jgi:hypothetical protein
MRSLALALFAAALLPAGASPSAAAKGRFAAPSEDVLRAAVRAARAEDALAERLRLVSEPFLGAPYAVSPLGEGEGTDPDPRIRYDAFDCTTFVETTMALALADDIDDAKRLLDVIRYRGGQPGFLARRHFPEAEWLPELRELGFLADTTRAVGGDEVVLEHKRLDLTAWERRKRPSVLELPGERIPIGTFSLDVWPLAAARKGHARIPPGTLLNLVRVDFRSVPVRVSHQGLVIEKGGELYLRHAADRMFHSVVDEPLEKFFARMQQYSKWPVAGVNLARVTAPPTPRVADAEEPAPADEWVLKGSAR